MCSVWAVPSHSGIIVGAADAQRLYKCMFLSAASHFCIDLSFLEALHDTPILTFVSFAAFFFYDDSIDTSSPLQRRESMERRLPQLNPGIQLIAMPLLDFVSFISTLMNHRPAATIPSTFSYTSMPAMSVLMPCPALTSLNACSACSNLTVPVIKLLTSTRPDDTKSTASL